MYIKRKIKSKWLFCFVWLIHYLPFTGLAQTLTKYSAANNIISGFNMGLYNNRPLYCNNANAFILAGDKPLARFAQTPYIYGSFMAAILHNDKLKWLNDCNSIKMEYNGNMTTCIITDTTSNFPLLKFSVIPMAGEVGMTIKVNVEATQINDKLIWMYGGAQYKTEGSLSWKFDITGMAEIGTWEFEAKECKGNQITINNATFCISPLADSTNKTGASPVIEGVCSADSKIKIVAADNYKTNFDQQSNGNPRYPVVSGAIDVANAKDVYWVIKPFAPKKTNASTLQPIDYW